MPIELQVGVKAIIQDKQGRILLLKRSQPYEREDFYVGMFLVAE